MSDKLNDFRRRIEVIVEETRLEGEYFDVYQYPGRPFIVKVSDINTKRYVLFDFRETKTDEEFKKRMKTMRKSPYAEIVNRIRSMASARYGREVFEYPGLSNERTWRFRNVPSGDFTDDPLCWRLDIYERGVSSHTVFQLYDKVTEELIEQRFLAMEVSREEFYEANQKLEGEE